MPGENNETWFDRAHSVYFDYLSETGILGFLSYLGMFFMFYWEFFKRSRISMPSRDCRGRSSLPFRSRTLGRALRSSMSSRCTSACSDSLHSRHIISRCIKKFKSVIIKIHGRPNISKSCRHHHRSRHFWHRGIRFVYADAQGADVHRHIAGIADPAGPGNVIAGS